MPRISLARLRNLALDILFPPLCLTCGTLMKGHEKHSVSCDACVAAVPLYDGLFCPACLRRIPHGGRLCHPEAKYVLAPAAHYGNGTVQKLVWQFKYHNWLSAGEPIARLMANYLKGLPHDFSGYSIVPVPLHKRREWSRGFNQAYVMGARIAAHLGIPVIAGNLVRAKETAAQADQKDYHAREENIREAFHALDPDAFKGKSVMLVDDVTTSGATLHEAAKVLKQCGAKNVIALVAARAR